MSIQFCWVLRSTILWMFNNLLQKPKPKPRAKHSKGPVQLEETAQANEGKEKFIIELPYDFEHGDRPYLSLEEHQGISSLRNTFQAIVQGLPDLNPANRDDLFPAYYAYRMGHLSGSFFHDK